MNKKLLIVFGLIIAFVIGFFVGYLPINQSDYTTKKLDEAQHELIYLRQNNTEMITALKTACQKIQCSDDWLKFLNNE